MTSVLPAWKLELIEKKKRKEQDQRQKIEDEKARNVSIPEWKRSLLEKKKECSSDSPETRGAEQPGAVSVNSVFGPRILRKTSEKTIAIVNASQRPVSKGEDEQINKRRVLQNHEFASNVGASKANTCVTRAVEIPTEVERRGNKQVSLQRGVLNDREGSQRSDVASPREDMKINVRSDAPIKAKFDNNDHVTVPSVLTYRLLFEQSKPGNQKEISEPRGAENIQSFIADSRSEERTTASNDTVIDNQQAISNKRTGNSAQSTQLRKSTGVEESEIISSPSFSVAPKPYKNFVSSPPWLKSSSPKSVSFQPGKIFFQETVVANANTEAEKACKDSQELDRKSTAIVESGAQEKVEKSSDSSDIVVFESAGQPQENVSSGSEEPCQQSLPDQTLEEYSVIKHWDAEEEQSAIQPVKATENQKYILIDSKSQQELTLSNENLTITSVREENFVQIPNEPLPQHEDSQEKTEDNISNQSSVSSIGSKFGPSVGFQRRTSSEGNLSQKSNQSQPIKQEGVLRRAGQSKKTQPAMVRWSADVVSLMSQPVDDNDLDMLTLSVRSESKLPSANNTQAKRPPPPVKRWTADVLSVTSIQADNDASDLSPRSDSSVRSSPSNSLNRARSSSLSDIREEHGFDYFQHKGNVSQGIEHRMHKLIRKASTSENILNTEQEDSDSLSDEDSLYVNGADLISNEVPNAHYTLQNELTDDKLIDSGPKEKDSKPLFSPVQETQPVFARKHSISQNIEHKLCELFHRQVSQQSDGGESEGERTIENDVGVTTDKETEMAVESTAELPGDEPRHAVTFEKSPDYGSTVLGDEPNEGVDVIKLEGKATKGSVHKLSALFGSSIWRPNKKDKCSYEDKIKDKASPEDKQQKIASLAKKEDGKKSNLFGKTPKTEGKNAEKKEKDSSNVNIFPWLKKQEKEKDRAGKTTSVENKNQKNSSSSSTDQDIDEMKIAVHGLRPVHKDEKVKHRQLVGKVMIVSNASHEKPPPKGLYHKPIPSVQPPDKKKERTPTEEPSNFKPFKIGRNEAQIPVVVTQHWNGNQHTHSPEPHRSTEESVPVTSIDEVPVSAIDIPESGESDIDVSVIDIPSSPDVHTAGKFGFLNGTSEGSPRTDDDDDDICVSVIDLPSPVAKEDEPSILQGGYLETEELTDECDTDELEGSYDFATGEVIHLVNGDSTQDSEEEGYDVGDDDDDEEEDEEEDDDDEDEDVDVPISYIGASPRYQVPQVVFDSEPVLLKSCLSPKADRKKLKGKVSFRSSHTVHDYPSEESFKAVYDEMYGNDGVPLKTLQNYQPSALVNMEKMLAHGKDNTPEQVKPGLSNGSDSGYDGTDSDSHPEIKYADEGQGFTDSTDYASALLF